MEGGGAETCHITLAKRVSNSLWNKGRSRTEPLDALIKAAERRLLTHSLKPADYSDMTKNAAFTQALLSQHLTETGPS